MLFYTCCSRIDVSSPEQAHQLKSKRPRWCTYLQRTGIMLSPEAHKVLTGSLSLRDIDCIYVRYTYA